MNETHNQRVHQLLRHGERLVRALARALAEVAHALLGRALNHPMPHAQDVPGARRSHHLVDGGVDLLLGAEEDHGVHIALQRHVRPCQLASAG
jgi:hypothetical protein